MNRHINNDCYVIAIDNTSKYATLKTNNPPGTIVKGWNDSDKAVFIVAGKTAPTAVFPTSASDPVKGHVIGAKQPFQFEITPDDEFISAIQPAAGGTGSLYFSVGTGQ